MLNLKNLSLHHKKGRINTALVFTWKSWKKRIFERFGLMIMYPISQMLIFHDHLRFTRPIPNGCDPGDWSKWCCSAPSLARLPCSIYRSKIIAVLKSLTSSTRTKVGGWATYLKKQIVNSLIFPNFLRFDKFIKDWNHRKPPPSDLVELLNADLVPDGSVLYWIWILQQSSRYSFQPSYWKQDTSERPVRSQGKGSMNIILKSSGKKSHQIILQHNYKWIPFYARTYSKGEYAMANIMMPMIYINILQRCTKWICMSFLQSRTPMFGEYAGDIGFSSSPLLPLDVNQQTPAMVSKKTVTLLWISWSKEFWEIVPWPQQICTELAEKKVATVTFALVDYVNCTLFCSCLGVGILDSVGCSNPKELTV